MASAKAWWAPRLLPLVMVSAGVATAIWLAIRSADNDDPLTGPEAGFLTLAATILNLGGGAAFTKIGKTSPVHARSAVRRLLTIARTIRMARGCLGDEAPKVGTARELLSSVELSLADAVRDWNDVHTEALREVVKGDETWQ